MCSDYSGSESRSDAFSSVPNPPEVPVKPCMLFALPFALRSNTTPDCPLCVSLALTLSADKKDSDFDMPFLWFLDSLQSKHVDRVLFQQYINLDTKSHHSFQIAELDVKTDGVLLLRSRGHNLAPFLICSIRTGSTEKYFCGAVAAMQ